MSNTTPEPDNNGKRKPGFIAVLMSTLAAALGVQSNRNRERDFQHGSLKVFIAAGVIFTVLFILIVVGVVRLVLRGSGL